MSSTFLRRPPRPTLRRLAPRRRFMVALSLTLAASVTTVFAQRRARHSAAHYEFRARAERAGAHPENYARDHLPHLLALWRGNRDGDLHFQADFRGLFLSAGAAVLAETAWTDLDPRFFFGFFADKHYTEDTGSCDDARGLRTSRFREVGIFNIPAGPPVICENSRQFQMIFGDHAGGRWRPAAEFRRERARLCEAHHAREASLRRELSGMSDAAEQMRVRVQRGPEYLGCTVQPSPTLLPSQEEGYNVFYDLAARAASPPTARGAFDRRLVLGMRRGVGLSAPRDAYVFDLVDDAWKRTDLRHMGEQMVLGFTMLDQDAAAAPSDAPPTAGRLPLWAQYWRAVLAVFAWSSGSGQIELIRSRAAVEAPLRASLAAWRSQRAEPEAASRRGQGASAVADLAAWRGPPVGEIPPTLRPAGLPVLSAAPLASVAAEGPLRIAASPAPSPSGPWDLVRVDRLRRPVVDGREVPPPYTALFRGLCAEYFDRCAGELRLARHARTRQGPLRDQHRYLRCSAVAPPRTAEARHGHPYYRLLRLAHRVESSRAFLQAIDARETLRVMDVVVGSARELAPAYQVITAAATGATLRVDDVSLEGLCGAAR